MKLTTALALGAAWVTTGGSAAQAVGGAPGSPDWPCPQRKVVKLSPSDLQWEGELPDAKGWRQDGDINKLVELLASRRVPIDEATAALKAYASKVPAAERKAKLTLVFGGLMETVNAYRSSVIDGIERFNRRQKGRAKEIEAEGLKLNELQRQAGMDPKLRAEADKAVELYDWNVRVFEERRQNLPIACDIPPAIDGRTFELGREIRELVKAAG
ncbi:MAG: hypothetical protein HC841_09790 [Verrucomicrobiae bacterium]|nr:hypothetical protein [Verrucomicrobiae bacterium]